jgi:small subunit ribosomal protein S17
MSPKSFTARVVSNKMDKTVVVMVETLRRHPKYKKVMRHRKKFKAHDGDNACHIGDVVRIVETRPLSKEKRWRVVEILGKGKVVEPPSIEDIEQ